VWRQWIVPCVLTALCVAGFTVLSAQHKEQSGESRSSGVGDCFAVVAARKSVGLAKADCAGGNATYKAVLTADSPDWSLDPGACPDGPYRAIREGTGDTLCLTLNVRAGDCLNRVTARTGTRTDLGKSRCDSSSESKVTEVTAGPRLSCRPGEKTTFYAQPATTICLGKP
jgi:hypothetical protein